MTRNRRHAPVAPPTIVAENWLLLLKVVESGGITRAATVLGLPQSQVSRRITDLEKRCGARIFERTGRGLALTAFGRNLLPKIEDLVGQSERLVGEILSSGSSVMGDVRIGLLPSLVPLLGPKLFKALSERFPKLRVHLTEASSAHLEEYLGSGRLDIATLLRDGAIGRDDGQLLWRLPLYLVGAADASPLRHDTVEFDAIDGLRLVLPAEPHVLRARLNALGRKRGISFTVAVEANSIQLQHELAAAGGVFAITARPIGQNEGLGASRIVRPGLVRSILLSTTPRRNETRGTREACRVVAAVASDALSTFGAPEGSDVED